MNYENILQFKGTWRVYQARVLDRAEHYVRDGKIHIVAAPGSGKTTLGIELIRRLPGNGTRACADHYNPGAVDRTDQRGIFV